MKEILRRTWAEIDLDAAAANFRAVKAAAGNAMVCAVVKADAYGHGAVELAREYQALGADWFAVSNIEEALQLRQGRVERPILVLGFTPADQAAALARHHIAQCVYSADYARDLSREAVQAGVTVDVHLKVDTGMSRLGFSFQDPERDAAGVEEMAGACGLAGLHPQGIFTHFAVSDGGPAGRSFTLRQLDCFLTAIARLEQRGVTFEIRHCANSAAIFDYPQTRLDMVRAGVVLYGLAPSGEVTAVPPLQPVLSLRSVVSHVKEIPAGTTVSYGRTYTAREPRRIATVPIGYADGYLRVLGGACVLIQGRRCPIVGRICMDQLMADVTALGAVSIGEPVTLIGRDGPEQVTADELAALEGTINYEVVCGISKRVPRAYLRGGKVVSIYNQLLQDE